MSCPYCQHCKDKEREQRESHVCPECDSRAVEVRTTEVWCADCHKTSSLLAAQSRAAALGTGPRMVEEPNQDLRSTYHKPREE